MIKKILFLYRNLPSKKQHIEFFSAILTVPVLLTVILLNVNNLKAEKAVEPSSLPKEEKIVISMPTISVPTSSDKEGESASKSVEQCTKEIAPIEIVSPKEGEALSDNPVSVKILYEQGEYCSSVWAYRINGGKWSEYGDQSISLYNLDRGVVSFELRVKSIVTGEEKILKRNFEYSGESISATPTLSEDQTSSNSAN